MSLAAALSELTDGLKAATRLQVEPDPPRQIPGITTVFFAGMRWARTDQAGGMKATIPFMVVVNSNTTFSLAELRTQAGIVEAYIDGAQLENGTVTFEDGAEWQIGWHDIAGAYYYAASSELALWY